jgi:transposase InsO family protein
VPLEVRELTRHLSRENRLWGAPRIQAELAKLAFHVAKSTVEKCMVRRTGPPGGKWRAFLCNHAGEVLACNFFVIPTAWLRTLIGFVVLELESRRIVACDVTEHPTARWAGSVVRRAVLAVGRRAQYLVRDRDAIHGAEFKAAMRGLGLRQMVCAYRSPLQNAIAERVIGTLRRECLDHVIVLNERHARRILEEFVAYYNAERAHQTLDGDSPLPHEQEHGTMRRVIAFPHLGGLHHSSRRAA